VGEVGTGKTLLCRKVLNSLGGDFVSAYIPNPGLTPDGLRLNFAKELEVDIDGLKGSYDLLERINLRLLELAADNKKVVLIVDEAQTMPEETIEALRLLTNLETESSKLFQVVLFGQPELDELLSRKSLRQLKQRITFSYNLKHLDQQGTEQYIQHRIALAGYNGMPIFDKKATQMLHQASSGTPRLINILSHKTLMSAFGKGDRQVQVAHVRSAVEDTEGVTLPATGVPKVTALVGLLVVAAAAGIAATQGLL
ncbi:MAG: AAA family ATPase, partial [Motiliproteus sp.]|nr:AAA family ATPase [Motiliproteus sp.]